MTYGNEYIQITQSVNLSQYNGQVTEEQNKSFRRMFRAGSVWKWKQKRQMDTQNETDTASKLKIIKQ